MKSSRSILPASGVEGLFFTPLPRWADLPDLDLYMDQVLELVRRSLGKPFSGDGKELTSSMVNNYVKHKVMPPPLRKRYGREHLACLIMICLLKRALPLPAIRSLLDTGREAETMPVFYDSFCASLDGAAAVALRELTACEEREASSLALAVDASTRAVCALALASLLCSPDVPEPEKKA